MCGPASTRAILMPNPFYPAYGAGARAPCEPVYPADHRANGFLPDLDALDEATLARTVAIYLASPANPQGSVATHDYFSAPDAARRPLRLLVLSATNAIRKSIPARPRAARSNARAPTSPAWLRSSRCRSARTCRAFASASPPATSDSSARFLSCVIRGAAGAGAAPACRDRRLRRRSACRGEPQAYRTKFDLADQIIGDRYGYADRTEASAWLNMSAHRR